MNPPPVLRENTPTPATTEGFSLTWSRTSLIVTGFIRALQIQAERRFPAGATTDLPFVALHRPQFILEPGLCILQDDYTDGSRPGKKRRQT